MAKRRRTKRIKGHFARRGPKKKRVPIIAHKRTPKPKRKKGIHKVTRNYEVTYYQDDQGRFIGKRKYKRLN